MVQPSPVNSSCRSKARVPLLPVGAVLVAVVFDQDPEPPVHQVDLAAPPAHPHRRVDLGLGQPGRQQAEPQPGFARRADPVPQQRQGASGRADAVVATALQIVRQPGPVAEAEPEQPVPGGDQPTRSSSWAATIQQCSGITTSSFHRWGSAATRVTRMPGRRT
jgi:hypothetical protein